MNLNSNSLSLPLTGDMLCNQWLIAVLLSTDLSLHLAVLPCVTISVPVSIY